MLRLEFYIPRGLEEDDDVKEIEMLLKKIESTLNINVKRFVIDKNEERDLKSKILWGLSVANRIKIKQTRKSKALYPQLIVLGGGKPITFYPQARVGKEIKIKDFLIGLLKGEIRCLHEKIQIEKELIGERNEK